MRPTILYIAMSLDGYIADKNGGVSWLCGDGSAEELDTYTDFIQDVDTVIMGNQRLYDIGKEKDALYAKDPAQKVKHDSNIHNSPIPLP